MKAGNGISCAAYFDKAEIEFARSQGCSAVKAIRITDIGSLRNATSGSATSRRWNPAGAVGSDHRDGTLARHRQGIIDVFGLAHAPNAEEKAQGPIRPRIRA